GVPGIYVPSDPGVTGDAAEGRLALDWGKAWLKSLKVMTGMAPVMNYNRQLAEAIMWDRMPWLSATVNVEVVSLDAAPDAYAAFDQGSSKKFVLDPHGMLAA
ncbi:MAG: formaldehyde dehydrogenase, glutathione-independent, partial [Hyphomicrobium sp.]